MKEGIAAEYKSYYRLGERWCDQSAYVFIADDGVFHVPGLGDYARHLSESDTTRPAVVIWKDRIIIYRAGYRVPK